MTIYALNAIIVEKVTLKTLISTISPNTAKLIMNKIQSKIISTAVGLLFIVFAIVVSTYMTIIHTQGINRGLKETFSTKIWLPQKVTVLKTVEESEWVNLHKPNLRWVNLPFDTYLRMMVGNSFPSFALIDHRGRMTYATRQESVVLYTELDLVEQDRLNANHYGIIVVKPEYIGNDTVRFNLNIRDLPQTILGIGFSLVAALALGIVGTVIICSEWRQYDATAIN